MESYGQRMESRYGSLRDNLEPSGPTSMRANLDEYDLLVVSDPNGISIGKITGQSSALSPQRFGEMFAGCSGSEECKAKLLDWLQKRTSSKQKRTSSKQVAFTILIPEEGRGRSEAFNFDFSEGANPFLKRTWRRSSFLEHGELVIVRKGYKTCPSVRIAVPKSSA